MMHSVMPLNRNVILWVCSTYWKYQRHES